MKPFVPLCTGSKHISLCLFSVSPCCFSSAQHSRFQLERRPKLPEMTENCSVKKKPCFAMTQPNTGQAACAL